MRFSLRDSKQLPGACLARPQNVCTTTATGTVLRPLDEAALRALLPELDRLGAASVAVAFLHSYASAVHERRVREILAEARPGLAVTLSSEVCPEVREY